jgi:hypothetical protein
VTEQGKQGCRTRSHLKLSDCAEAWIQRRLLRVGALAADTRVGRRLRGERQHILLVDPNIKATVCLFRLSTWPCRLGWTGDHGSYRVFAPLVLFNVARRLLVG